MGDTEHALMVRMGRLDRRLRVMTVVTMGLAAWVVVERGTPARAGGDKPTELTASKLTIVDAKGRPRVILGSDETPGRISAATGLFLIDKAGAERGGLTTMDDGSALLALDSPAGVGSPMRDRLALKVYRDGSATIQLINNQTGIPVQLVSEADGPGGVEFMDYDLKARKVFVKRIGFKGESTTEHSLD